MGTTLSSCSHLVAGELLRLWRQATVIMVDCILRFKVLAHIVDKSATHRFRIQLFMALSSGCPYGFPYGQPSWTECLSAYSMGSSLALSSCIVPNIPAFQLSCSPE